jgi:hypothetical protein
MIRNAYELRLCIQAPLLIHVAGSLDLGVDAATQRYRGRPVLNGSLVRGNLRHLLLDFADEIALAPLPPSDDIRPISAADVETWLGPDSDSDGEPRIAALRFDLFWRLDELSISGDTTPPDQSVRHRIAISEDGVVKRGHIQVAEAAFPAGTEPQFVGRIQARFPDEPARRHCEHWLGKALRLLPAVGAFKGVGYGRLVRTELARIEPIIETGHRVRADRVGSRFGILLHLDRPFHVARTAQFQPKGNRLLHDDQIPGNALKAVMAITHGGNSDALQRDLDFDCLAVTAALPARQARPRRALPLPLSLAVFLVGGRQRRVMDLALHKKPMLLKDDKDLIAPTFQPDWKDADREEAELQFGHAPERPEHLLLVRTAIDRQRGYSEESKLFAPECTDVPGYVWCADIDLNDVHPNDENARREVTENLLDLLAGGLPDLGKTRARARVEVRERPFFDTSVAPEPLDDIEPGKDTWIVLLRTAARLLPARLEEKRIPPTGGADALLSAYGDYWKRASDDRLALRHYYAQQEMVGGPYYWRHFRAREDYRPEWLTLAGGVFVLQSAPADRKAVQHHLTHWLQGGLPKAEDRHQDDWRGNPYLGENGFGEIAVNHPDQLRHLDRPLKTSLIDADEALS